MFRKRDGGLSFVVRDRDRSFAGRVRERSRWQGNLGMLRMGNAHRTIVLSVLVSRNVAGENTHNFVGIGGGLQGTPLVYSGITERVEVANGAVDNSGKTDITSYSGSSFEFWAGNLRLAQVTCFPCWTVSSSEDFWFRRSATLALLSSSNASLTSCNSAESSLTA